MKIDINQEYPVPLKSQSLTYLSEGMMFVNQLGDKNIYIVLEQPDDIRNKVKVFNLNTKEIFKVQGLTDIYPVVLIDVTAKHYNF